MVTRRLTERLLAAMKDTPVVFLHGARQTGKSTLARWWADKGAGAKYITMDDVSVMSSAQQDPSGFLADLPARVVIDEVQRVPALFLALKAEVDRRRQPGRFLLTGSVNALMVPDLSSALAGRMEVMTLWPFSQGEMAGTEKDFIERLVKGEKMSSGPIDMAKLAERMVMGGYPEAVERRIEDRRRAWFGSYISTVLQRDIRDLSRIEGLGDLPRLMSLLAARSPGLLNVSEISRSLGVPVTSLRRYLTLLEATFMVYSLQPWSGGRGLRVIRAPKLHLTDSGLACHLLNLSGGALVADPVRFGLMLESFVFMELVKQMSWNQRGFHPYHFRDSSGREVDIVIEDSSGSIWGIEVKSARTVRTDDFKGLRALALSAGKRFKRGVLLYGGKEHLPFGDGMEAIPLNSVWS